MVRYKPLKPDLAFDLINAFKSIKSADESALFLQDILTANEIKNLSVRLRIARLLLNNEKHREISRKLRISVATVTKVSTWLGEKGKGFREIIARLPVKYNVPTKLIRGPIEFHLPEVLAASIQYGIAKHQNKRIEKFIYEVEEKASTDKELKEMSDEIYKRK